MGYWEPKNYEKSTENKVPKNLMLRGYAVTRLRLWYCINKCTRLKLRIQTVSVIFSFIIKLTNQCCISSCKNEGLVNKILLFWYMQPSIFNDLVFAVCLLVFQKQGNP